MRKQYSGKVRASFLAFGVLLLFCGYLAYLLYRGNTSTALNAFPLSEILSQLLPHPAGHAAWSGWAPSFLFVFGISIISIGLLNIASRARYAISLFWLVIAAGFELGQKYRVPFRQLIPAAWQSLSLVILIDNHFRLGTFDPLDIAACGAGFLAAIALLYGTREKAVTVSYHRPFMQHARVLLFSVIALFGILCIVATSPAINCDNDPVYLSYSDLRKPVIGGAPTALTDRGKIYLYGNLLFVNQPNKGIHVFNNADPHSPVNQVFMPIPGNLDIAIKDSILYADSYVDLVAIDIGDLNNVHEVNRVQDVFPYDPYQNITDSTIEICSFDSGQGIVVDYRKKQQQGGGK